MRRVVVRLLIVGAVLLAAAAPGRAAQSVAVGKAVSEAWTFLPLDIGQRYGIFARYGLEVNIVNFEGDAKMQQGLASGSVGLGLGSGPAMAFAAKGAPAMAVAAYFGAPRNLSVIIGADSPITSVKDLKGKTLAISTTGSLTEWLVQRIALAEGWGKDGIKTAALGGVTPGIAAMRAGQVDGVLGATEAGLTLEEKHAGRVLLTTDQFAPVFITHVVFARKALIADDPDLITRFLKGFFATIDFIKTHKAETSQVAEAVRHLSPAVAEQAYDREMPGFIPDGRFDPKAVAVLKKSFVEMGILPTEPKDSDIFTTKFVPVKVDGHAAESGRP